MASVSVRYTNGDDDEWELTDQMHPGRLAKVFASTTADGMVSFAVASDEGGVADFDFVGVRMAEISTWHVHGLLDVASSAALWAELHPSKGEDGTA
jgi:hypothetical protein